MGLFLFMTLLYGTIIYVLTIGKLLLWAFFVLDQVEMQISLIAKFEPTKLEFRA